MSPPRLLDAPHLTLSMIIVLANLSRCFMQRLIRCFRLLAKLCPHCLVLMKQRSVGAIDYKTNCGIGVRR